MVRTANPVTEFTILLITPAFDRSVLKQGTDMKIARDDVDGCLTQVDSGWCGDDRPGRAIADFALQVEAPAFNSAIGY